MRNGTRLFMSCGLLVLWCAIMTMQIISEHEHKARVKEMEAEVGKLAESTQQLSGGAELLKDSSFELGFEIGYACHAYGGNKFDCDLLMGAFRSNRIDILNAWLEAHHPRPRKSVQGKDVNL